jgi:hypothetical protein
MDETEAVARALASEAFGQPFDQCRFYAQEACRIFARTAIAALEEYRARDEEEEAQDFLRRVSEAPGETLSDKYRAFMRDQAQAGL